jgi:hypothetical protein
MSQAEWYYARDNKQMGPVSPAELKRLAMFDELRPEDLVWREGMTEWAAARNVRGLFGSESGDAAAAAAGGSALRIGESGLRTVASPAKPQPASAAPPRRHLFESLMDSLRSSFNPHFVDSTAGVFRACGLYGLFVAAALAAIFAIVAGTKADPLENLLWGAIWVLLLLALHFVAGKSLAAIEHVNRTTAGHLSSSVVPDCAVALALVIGIRILLASIASAVETSNYLSIVFGIASFFVYAYLAVVALNWSMLNISTAPEVAPGEELIGVLMFVFKAILRLAPVAFGAGVLCGTIAMGVACYLAFTGEVAARAIGGALPGGALSAANGAMNVLISSAAAPLAAYLLFLLVNLVLNLWRAVLSLPGKLDVLAAKHDEIGRDQPDTVTTHE